MGVNSHLKTSTKGRNFIKGFEKLSSIKPNANKWVNNWQSYTGSIYAYWDSVGKVYTIGWGHTGGVYKGQIITVQQAERYFEKDLRNKAETFVRKFIKVPLSQGQFDALVSFTFNAGCGSLQDSKIRRYINRKQFDKAYTAWLSQNTRGGNTHLKKRRKAEANYFRSSISGGDGTITVVNDGSQSVEEFPPILPEEIIEKEIVREKFIEYVHNSNTYTVDELLDSDTFIVKKNQIEKSELLGISFKGKTNHQRLFDNLSKEQKKIFGETYDIKVDYPVTNGVILIIPNDKVEIGMNFQSELEVQTEVFADYFPGILRAISNDPGYKTKYRSNKDDYLRDQHSVLTAFAWSRSLYLQEENIGWLDITKDIISVTTSNSSSGGSGFSIELAPIQAEFVEGKWVKKGVIELSSGEVVSQTAVNYIGKATRRRSHFYYKEIFQENDLVFISFEQLLIEEDRKTIANNWYDLIGMIDSIQVVTTGNNQISIILNGRSLEKVLHNDNSYFNPYSVGHSASIFGKTPLSNERFLDGKFYNLESVLNRSIAYSIQFIFHRISSIDFVPDDIFNGFENLTVVSSSGIRSTDGIESDDTYELYKNVYRVKPEKQLRGIWQIMKLFVDESVRDLRIVDDSISNPNGSVYDLITKICQEPFVEFFTDSYGDKFYLIIRRPPFDQDALIDALFSSDEIAEDFERYSETSLVEESRKRKEDYLLMEARNDKRRIGGDDVFELQDVSITPFPRMITIGEESVLGENLSFSTQAYSWFQLTDRGNYGGTSVDHGVYPGVYFDEIAQVFGNNRLSVVSNYSNQDFWTDNKEEKRLDKYAKHASELLGWMIETHIYLPFTRYGTITIQGDRRIKAGMFIYYKPTNEVFYVRAVTNQLSISSKIDRVTQLTVERGMVKQYIGDSQSTESGQTLSYFNLVDIDSFVDSYYKVIAEGTSVEKFDYKSGLGINKEVFDFFLRRKQFLK